MKELLDLLIYEFNDYSELVALNYAHIREGRLDDGMLQWNRGSLSMIEEHMEKVAALAGVTLEYECGEHVFGYGDFQRTLTYRTVKKQ